MKFLDGAELASYMTERQARQVRALRQAHHVFPTVALIVASDDPVIHSYVDRKVAYGEDILVNVVVFEVAQTDIASTIESLNNDDAVHGIVLQLPLPNPSETDAFVALIAPHKDVDGLGPNAEYSSATAQAIDWLLAGYNVDLKNKSIAILGNGRLVGKPLAKLWATTGYDVSVYDETTEDLQAAIRRAQVVIAATGQPGLVTEHMLQPAAVVVDAGTAVEAGKIVGDVAESVRETRQDLTITPVKGGVGPLTIVALFDAVIQAATKTVAD